MLLSLRQLRITFGPKTVVDGVSLSLQRGQTLGLVGASGSGKSVTCHAIARLLPASAHVTGEVLINEQNVLAMSPREVRAIRGKRVAMIFQNPMHALNPVHRIGRQMEESLLLHRGLSGRAARAEAVSQLDAVGIPDAEDRLRAFPHQLSGGLCQRVMIAMALSAQPDLLIADEPTTALDLTTQAQILDLLRHMQAEHGTALLFVTHDMGVIAQMAHQVVVLDKGTTVESGPVREVFSLPTHAVTRHILSQAQWLPPPKLSPPPLLQNAG